MTPLHGAKQELAAAHVLAVSGLTAQAVGTALRTALRAAEAALLLIERVPPAEPGGVVTDFLRHVVLQRGLEADTGRRLRALLDRDRLAEVVPPPAAVAEAAIADAAAVAEAAIADAAAVAESVAAWIEVSERVRRERRAPGG